MKTVQDILKELEEGTSYDVDILGNGIHWRMIGNSEIWSHCVYNGSGTQEEIDALMEKPVHYFNKKDISKEGTLIPVVEVHIYVGS